MIPFQPGDCVRAVADKQRPGVVLVVRELDVIVAITTKTDRSASQDVIPADPANIRKWGKLDLSVKSYFEIEKVRAFSPSNLTRVDERPDFNRVSPLTLAELLAWMQRNLGSRRPLPKRPAARRTGPDGDPYVLPVWWGPAGDAKPGTSTRADGFGGAPTCRLRRSCLIDAQARLSADARMDVLTMHAKIHPFLDRYSKTAGPCRTRGCECVDRRGRLFSLPDFAGETVWFLHVYCTKCGLVDTFDAEAAMSGIS